jgi:hypothetical protein
MLATYRGIKCYLREVAVKLDSTRVNDLMPDINLDSICGFSSYHTVNILRLHFKFEMV